MAITKTATNCPAPQVYTDFMYLEDYEVASGVLPDLISALPIIAGGTVWSPSANYNAAYLDVLGSYGGSKINGIVHGLTLSDGGGLEVDIAIGGAIIGAVVQVPTALSAVLTDNSDNWIWLLQTGAIEVKTTTSAPATPACLLGLVVTSGGVVTTVDVDGAVSLRGIPYRKTADLAYPTDTPNSGICLITETAGGTYLWDGTDYKELHSPLDNVVARTTTTGETASDYHKIITNEGATSKPTYTLPTAVAGVRREYVIQDSDGARIQANTGDTIRDGSSVSASAGYIESTTVGSTICLLAINATEWIVMYKNGTWGSPT